MTDRWSIHNGDCLDILRSLPDASFDGLLSDPPSGIGFMGADWDKDKGGRDEWIAWLESIMREVLRVLKPGAHGLIWALPRTSHWTGMAIERSGFVVRDRMSHIFATGFPKSLAIDKAIDALNGDERPVLGEKRTPDGKPYSARVPNSVGRYSDACDHNALSGATRHNPMETAAASAASAAWSGYGTAMKPAVEDWWLVMKPVKGTFAENALKHGTGGINIDGCRIGYASEEDKAAAAAAAQRLVQQNHGAGVGAYGLHGANAVGSIDGFLAKQDLGRWPAHLVLSHSPDCKVVGSRQTTRPILGADPNGSPVKSVGFTRGSHAQVKRTEVTEVTQCVESCPVRQLDNQSGNRPGMSGGGLHRPEYGGGMFGAIDAGHLARNDSGGASRFFRTFAAEDQWEERCDLARIANEASNQASAPVDSVPRDAATSARLEGRQCAVSRERSTSETVPQSGPNGVVDTQPIQSTERKCSPVSSQESTSSNDHARCAETQGQTVITTTTANRSPFASYVASVISPSIGTSSGLGAKDYATFIYCAKPSTAERDFGCEALPERSAGERVGRDEDSAAMNCPRTGAGRTGGARNHHPTVKSVRLAQYLATMILPPVHSDGTPRRLINPFSGSGTECIGAVRAGWDHVIGIERDPEYAAIAEARLARWAEVPADMDPGDVKPEKSDPLQGNLFGNVK